jgi:hypothetical protein
MQSFGSPSHAYCNVKERDINQDEEPALSALIAALGCVMAALRCLKVTVQWHGAVGIAVHDSLILFDVHRFCCQSCEHLHEGHWLIGIICHSCHMSCMRDSLIESQQINVLHIALNVAASLSSWHAWPL